MDQDVTAEAKDHLKGSIILVIGTISYKVGILYVCMCFKYHKFHPVTCNEKFLGTTQPLWSRSCL